MVLWEITLGTAYFLGLKRTYKLALKIQRKLISPDHQRTRQFLQRRTRVVFDAAIKVHRSIQESDIEIGRNLGNWILRWLDRMKPSAQIRGNLPPESNPKTSNQSRSLSKLSSYRGYFQKFRARNGANKAGRQLFSPSRNLLKPFPTISMVLRPPVQQAGGNILFRQFNNGSSFNLFEVKHGKFGNVDVTRNDIRWWITHH